MSAMSDYLEEVALNCLLNGAAWPSLPSVWLGLAVGSVFTDSSYASEASGGGYARKQLTAAFTTADAGGGQWQSKNTAGIAFVEATGAWGEIVGWGLFDAASAGNLLVHGAWDTSRQVYTGNTFYIEPDGLVIEAQ